MVACNVRIMDEKISKINILELVSNFGYAGGTRNMIGFCKYLNRKYFNIFAAAYSGGVGEKSLIELGVPYAITNTADEIMNYIKKNNIQVVHIHRSGFSVPLEVELVSKIHTYDPRIVIVEKNVFGGYTKAVADHIHCSFFQSKMHIHERYLPRSGKPFNGQSMRVLYNMVDAEALSKYTLTPEEIVVYKKSLGIEPEDFVIGKIARAHVAKWSDLVIEMMPYLVDIVPNIKFIIIGVPQSRKRRIERSGYSNHFIIRDETSSEKEIHSFYQALDVLVHSSKIGECNGNTINEAMFWKKPVVVNSTPRKDNGQLEQIDHMKNGIIANHPQTMARAVGYVLSNRAILREMGDAANRKVFRDNRPVHITSQFEKVVLTECVTRGMVDVNIRNAFDAISFSPTTEDIIAYKEKYPALLQVDFGTLSVTEKCANILRLPFRLYYKVRDFLEDKLK